MANQYTDLTIKTSLKEISTNNKLNKDFKTHLVINQEKKISHCACKTVKMCNKRNLESGKNSSDFVNSIFKYQQIYIRWMIVHTEQYKNCQKVVKLSKMYIKCT